MLSKYVSIVKLEDFKGLYALYSYLHRGLGIFSEETVRKLLDNNFDALNEEEKNGLNSIGALVKNSAEDSAIAMYLFHKLQFESNHAYLTLVTTYDCNLNCYYCMQKNIPQEKKASFSGSEDIFRWLEQWLSNSPIKDLSINIIGGEPLLNIEPIFDLGRILDDLNVKRNVSLTTNGTMLNPSLISILAAQGVEKIQITFDGPRAVHNEIKDNSFDKLIEVCNDIIDFGIQLHIRINYAPERQDLAEETLLDLSKLINLESNRVFVYFSRLFDTNNLNCDFNANENINLIKKAVSLGFYFPMPLGAPMCSGNSEYGFVITPDKRVYKCYGLIGEIEHEIGYIDNGNMYVDNHESLIRQVRNECVICKYFPICNGGCKAQRHFAQKKEDELICNYENYELISNELLPLYLSQRFDKQLQMLVT